MEKCDCCGNLFDPDDINNYNGENLCDACAAKKRQRGEI